MSPTVIDDVETELVERALFCGVAVRGIDEESRQATFIAATENAVSTYGGREVLRMSGIKLGRFRANPVVLDSHNRYEAGAVIGNAAVKVENRKLVASITFAETDRAEEVWQLVRGGFLKALSIGYSIDRASVTEIAEGQTDGSGDAKVEGPATIVKGWELYEISVVPVPADPGTLARAFNSEDNTELAHSAQSIIHSLQRYTQTEINERSQTMADKPTNEKKPAEGEQPQPSEQVRELEPTTLQTIEPRPEIPEEKAARAAEARRREIMAITPRDLQDVAEICIMDGLSLEDTRAKLKAAKAERTKPVGTPEPDTTTAPTDNGDKTPKVADIPDDVLERSLKGGIG